MERSCRGAVLVAIGALLMLLVGAASASAAPFANGSFETPLVPGSFIQRDAPYSFGDWVVTAGSVDHVRGYWQAAAGSQSIDLDGADPGTLCQTFDTAPGSTTVRFMLSHNPAGAATSGTLRVLVNGTPVGTFTHSLANTRTNMMWQSHSATFTGVGATTQLCFQSLTPGAFGPAIDAVTIVAASSRLSINDVTVTEPTAGASPASATFTVSLDTPSAQPVTVRYATSNGPPAAATAGPDYAATSGTLTFAAGQTSRTVAVPVLADGFDEPAEGGVDPAVENFRVTLSTPTNATIAKAIGTAKILDDATLTANQNDKLDVQKAEQFVGLAPGQVRTVTQSCPAGYVVLDGSTLIQEVDQGTGTLADIEVLRAESTSAGAYTFTLRNPTAGNAQAKVFVTCVKSATFDGGTISVSSGAIQATVPFAVGSTTRTLSCPAGATAVDPGFNFASGRGAVSASQPAGSLRSWTFTITATEAGSVTLSIRCLSNATSDGDQLRTQELTQTVMLLAHQTVTAKLTCPVDFEGVTASYSVPAGVALLGNEPQPITRVFTLQNTSSRDQTATIDLLCLSNTTSHDG